MDEQEKREALQGMLIHFLYTFCLCNDIPMGLFSKGKEDLKERLNNFYYNIERLKDEQ